jgi:hypothetical protein
MELDFVRSDILKQIETHTKDAADEMVGLDQKAQQHLTVSSIIVGFLAAINLGQASISGDKRIFLGLLAAFYIVSFLLSLIAMRPRNWMGGPIIPNTGVE